MEDLRPDEKAKQLVARFIIEKATVFYKENSVPCVVNGRIGEKSAVNFALLCADEVIKNTKVTDTKELHYWLLVSKELKTWKNDFN